MTGSTTTTARVIWHTLLSIDGFIAGPDDGFIAGPDDDMQWVFGVDDGGGTAADDVVRSIGALLVGRRTQSVEDRLQPGFYGGAYSGPFFVLRHDPPSEPPGREPIRLHRLAPSFHNQQLIEAPQR